MVPCLYLGNIYTKRKLRVWIDQKCIPLVGAIIPLTCAGSQKIHRLEGGSIRPSTESCINCDALMSMVWCLHQGNISIKRKLRVWRDQKYIPLVSGITPLNCAGRHNTPSRGRQYREQNGKFGKLGRTYSNGTVFEQRKYLYQKEAMGMERPEMYSVSLCNNPSYLCGPS